MENNYFIRNRYAVQIAITLLIAQARSYETNTAKEFIPPAENTAMDIQKLFSLINTPNQLNDAPTAKRSLLNEEVTLESSRIRTTRDVDIYSICSVKEQDLVDILDVINGSNLSPETIIRLHQNKSSGERCKQLLQGIKEAAQRLRDDYRRIQDTRYRTIKIRYEKEVIELKAKIAELEDSNWKTKAGLNVVLGKSQQVQNHLNNALTLTQNVRRKVIEQTIRLCGALISNGQIDEAMDEFIMLNDTKEINRIVGQGYNGNIANFPKLVKFIERLDGNDKLNLWSMGYTLLFNELKRNNHLNQSEIFSFAYKIKGILNGGIDIFDKRKFERLKNNLPSVVKAIVWGQVCLKNKFFNEYLYPGDDNLTVDNDRRRVFTWVPQGGKFPEGYWMFEPSTLDTKYHRVKNTRYNEYFFAAYAKYNDDRREVYTWRPKTDDNGCVNEQCMWEVSIESENSVKLRNVQFKEYLYSTHGLYDKKRRRALTWKPGTCDEQCVWEIITC